jgi:hypothetical protein
MPNANAVKQLRGCPKPKRENWPVSRVGPARWPGGYGLKSGENGHLARANGAIDGPYCPPTSWLSACRRQCELVGRIGAVLGGGGGGGG